MYRIKKGQYNLFLLQKRIWKWNFFPTWHTIAASTYRDRMVHLKYKLLRENKKGAEKVGKS